MAEDNRPLINKILNPYPNLPGLAGLGFTSKDGKKYFVGKDKGLSSLVSKDYTDPNITIGETLLKGLGSVGDAGLETLLGVYDTAMRAPQGFQDLLTAKSPIAKDVANVSDALKIPELPNATLDEIININKMSRNPDLELRQEEDEGLADPYASLEGAELAPEDEGNPSDIQKKLGNLSKSLESDLAPEDRGDPSDEFTIPSEITEKKENDLEQDKLDELFTSALQSAADAREGQPTKRKKLEDYKKEFSDATGIDTSGKVDKSSALMALGLALMQNKAGKGFNVGNMLSAVGEAGEKALPAFEKAKQQAKLASAKAGEYALGRVAEDKAEAKLEQEEMLNRTSYYIVPKGSRDAQGVAKSFSDGRFTRLNKFELNKLATNQEFNDKFEILDGSLYGDALTEMLKTPEAASEWNDKVQKGIKLFNDAPEEFQIDAYYYNAESGKQGGRPAIGTDYLLNNFEEAEKKLQRVENDFSNIIQATTAGGGPGISFGPQLGAAVENFGKAFGIGTGTGVNPITQAQQVLKRIQATNATDILQETGKTLSDNDRKLVERIVGEIDFSILGANEELLLKKLEQIYNLTVGKSRANLKAARKKLNEFGVDIPTKQDYSDKFSETDKIVEGI